jgi:hypothetical protein
MKDLSHTGMNAFLSLSTFKALENKKYKSLLLIVEYIPYKL